MWDVSMDQSRKWLQNRLNGIDKVPRESTAGGNDLNQVFKQGMRGSENTACQEKRMRKD